MTQGSATNLSQSYDPATNHAIGGSYDANGNTYTAYDQVTSIGYDAENRMSPACSGCGTLNYDPAGKRVAVVSPDAGTWTLYFYDIFGQRILTLPSTLLASSSLYFGSKLVLSDGVAVITDRLGSVRANSNNETFSYFPYGEERTPTANWRVKFGTYFRDYGNWDYADQRYYNPGSGRFNTPDPAGIRAVNPVSPSSWNRYAYVNGDPINHSDRSGLINDGDSLEWADDSGGGSGGFCVPQPIGETGIYYDCTVPSSGPNDPSTYQGRPAGDIIAVNGYTTSGPKATDVQNALRWLQAELPDDQDCDKYLASNHLVIDQLLGNTGGAMMVGVGTFSDPSVNAVAGTGGTNLPVGAGITVNLNGAYFNPAASTGVAGIAAGSAAAQAFILLHELAHSTGAQDFWDNDKSKAAQDHNNGLIMQHCDKTINFFAKP